jgi:hypothetical protein
MDAENPNVAGPSKPRFGQVTLGKLFIGIALICVVLGWRQMEHQFAFNELWELASEMSAWRDHRVQNDVHEAMYRLGLVKGLDPPPFLVSRIDEQKRQLVIAQLHHPLDPAEQTYVRLTVLNRFGKVNSVDQLEIGAGHIAIDQSRFERKRDGMAIITLQVRISAKPIPEALILIVENGKLKAESLPVELSQ